MVHPFFQAISTGRDLAEHYASSKPQPIHFTELFAIFFPVGGHQNYGTNLCFWLNVISTHFSFDEGLPHPYVVQSVENLFQELSINQPRNSANIHVFHFWLFLHYVFWKLVKTPYDRDDKVFQFMNGHSIENTRVVILGNDPAEGVDSSGFAFHGSPTDSTDQLLDFLKEEMTLVSQTLDQSKFKIAEGELEESKLTANLNTWIQQGVLLMNASLTYSPKGEDTVRDAWDWITGFILNYLSNTKPYLVFLLLGGEAGLMEGCIDTRKHLVIPLYHPSYYKYPSFQLGSLNPEKDWGVKMPFLNTNFFLRQKIGAHAMIDFYSICEAKEEKNARVAHLEKFFQGAMSKVSGTGSTSSVPISNGMIVERMNESTVLFKNKTRMTEIDASTVQYHRRPIQNRVRMQLQDDWEIY